MPEIKCIKNPLASDSIPDSSIKLFDISISRKIRKFHSGIPGYSRTPLVSLNRLADRFGLAGIYIKDESYRFGLNAFKALGGTYAVARSLASKLQIDLEDTDFIRLKEQAGSKGLDSTVFATATDGNHGRGVAWAANCLGCRSKVYLPKGSSPARVQNIRNAGGEAYLTEFNFDNTVKMVAELAAQNGWEMVQDTVCKGCEETPVYVMQGYLTMADEAAEQLASFSAGKPTHIVLQAGIGSMAAAVAGYMSSVYKYKEKPVIIVLEPDKADCFYKSAEAGEESPKSVAGEMNTIMAGLACGVPDPIAWKLLRSCCEAFVSITDDIAARGMRILGNPLKGDERIISGESGASALGFLSVLMEDSRYETYRKDLKLDADSRVLLFSTEGDTDPGHYRKIVWDG